MGLKKNILRKGSKLVLLGLRRKEHSHPLTLEHRHLLNLGDLLKVISEAEEENLTLLLEEDGPAAEEDIGLDLRAFLNELLGVLELEVIVMIISLRPETDLLDSDLDLLGLDFLLLLLLLVEEFLVVKDFANRRLGGGRDLHEVKLHLIGQLKGLLGGVDTRVLNVIAYEAHLRDTDFVINPVLSLRLLWSAATLKISAISAVASGTPIVGCGGVHHAL